MEKELCLWLNSEDNLDDLKALHHALSKTFRKNEKSKGHVFTFCITGEFDEPRKEIISKFKKLYNWEFVNTVTKETNLLIAATGEGQSGKMKTAERLAIPVVIFDGIIDYASVSSRKF